MLEEYHYEVWGKIKEATLSSMFVRERESTQRENQNTKYNTKYLCYSTVWYHRESSQRESSLHTICT
jgi:hypothetical protein